MNTLLQVGRYIVKNNPWYILPWRFLEATFYQCHKRTSKKLSVKTLFNGKQSYLFSQNPISSALVYTAVPDQNEINALRKLADSNTVFLDIGANIGIYSLFLADIVKSVFAFEAHPQTAKCCKMNFALNKMDEKQVIEMAVSDNNQPMLFSNEGQASPVNRIVDKKENAITVLSTTLDQFIFSQNFSNNTKFILKIDVEGHEFEVLNGARNFLKEYPVKAIIFETFSPKNNEIIHMLESLGFKIDTISDNNMLALR